MNLQEFHVTEGFCWLAERMFPSQEGLFHSSCSADRLQIPATALQPTCQPSSKSLSIHLQCRREGEAGTFTWAPRSGKRAGARLCYTCFCLSPQYHYLSTVQINPSNHSATDSFLGFSTNIRGRSALAGARSSFSLFPIILDSTWPVQLI